MIPLVAYEKELEVMRRLVERVVDEEDGRELHVTVGTMVELPRACFVADRIAEVADFFSFGTNDLTQTALGFSRDDVEGKFLNCYIETKIVDRSPFETLDKPGVGWLVRLAAWTGREAKPDLKLGICGEHGGDPESIDFFHIAGLDYVSCSPFRVPIARVAAARAALSHARLHSILTASTAGGETIPRMAISVENDFHDRMAAAEAALLSPLPARSYPALRAVPDPHSPLRTPFQRDRDRIVHSKAFRRLKHKTQVFIA